MRAGSYRDDHAEQRERNRSYKRWRVWPGSPLRRYRDGLGLRLSELRLRRLRKRQRKG